MPLAAWSSAHTAIRRWVNRSAGGALALAILLALSSSARMIAQNGQTIRYGPPSSKPNDTSMPLKDTSGMEDQKLLQMRNAARQISMVSDAGKLLRLANELHAELAAANTATLTPAQLRKLQQIEKLARNVRSKMAIAVGDSQGGPMPIQSLGVQ
jgi:hypothetical protein